MADFLVIAGVTLRVPRGSAERQPDGYGMSRYVVTTIAQSRADEATLRAAIGVPSLAESERSWAGVLHTDRPVVPCTGEAFGTTEGASGTVYAEVTITGASYRHYRDPDTGALGTRRTLALTIRQVL